MRLYYFPLSSFSQRVRIALDEKGLTDVELVQVDIPQKANWSPTYLAKNPYGRIPALEDGDFLLYESTAILEYLELLHPSPPLAPADPKRRALMAMHMKLADLEIGVHTGTLIRPVRFLPEERWDLTAMAKARQGIDAHLRILDGQLGAPFLLGEQFTLADVCYAPFLRFLDALGLQGTPRISAWAERVLARPSVRRTWLER